MLQINHIVLNQGIVYHIIHVQFEPPRHRDFSLARKVHEMSDYLIRVRVQTLSFYWNVVSIVRFDWLLIDVCSCIGLVIPFDELISAMPNFSKVRYPLLNSFLIMMGESKGIGMSVNSNER